jgi:hypothetical protein
VRIALQSRDNASSTRAAISPGQKKSVSRPFSPSRITSSTGGVREPMTTQPADIASSIDHESTNG